MMHAYESDAIRGDQYGGQTIAHKAETDSSASSSKSVSSDSERVQERENEHCLETEEKVNTAEEDGDPFRRFPVPEADLVAALEAIDTRMSFVEAAVGQWPPSKWKRLVANKGKNDADGKETKEGSNDQDMEREMSLSQEAKDVEREDDDEEYAPTSDDIETMQFVLAQAKNGIKSRLRRAVDAIPDKSLATAWVGGLEPEDFGTSDDDEEMEDGVRSQSSGGGPLEVKDEDFDEEELIDYEATKQVAELRQKVRESSQRLEKLVQNTTTMAVQGAAADIQRFTTRQSKGESEPSGATHNQTSSLLEESGLSELLEKIEAGQFSADPENADAENLKPLLSKVQKIQNYLSSLQGSFASVDSAITDKMEALRNTTRTIEIALENRREALLRNPEEKCDGAIVGVSRLDRVVLRTNAERRGEKQRIKDALDGKVAAHDDASDAIDASTLFEQFISKR